MNTTTDTRTVELIIQAETGGWTAAELGHDPKCHTCAKRAYRYLSWYGAYLCPRCYLAGAGIDTQGSACPGCGTRRWLTADIEQRGLVEVCIENGCTHQGAGHQQ